MQLSVNGSLYDVTVPEDEPLLWVLHDDLALAGTKPGCNTGHCGCCIVLVDGQPVTSCTTSTASVTGKHIRTIESLAAEEALTPVQQAFIDMQASQCSWCLPALVLVTTALLDKDEPPTDADIDAAMDRVMCRCGIYGRIKSAMYRQLQ